MPKVSSTTKTFEDVLTAIKNKGLKVTTAKDGVNIINSNGLCIDIIAPVSDSYDEVNDYSAVVKLTYLNNTFLFMGDAEGISIGLAVKIFVCKRSFLSRCLRVEIC